MSPHEKPPKKKTLLEATRAPAPWHAPGTVGHIAVVAKGAKGIQDVTTTYHDGGMGSCNPSETNQLGKKKRIGIPGPRVAQSDKSSNRLSACFQSTPDLRRLPRDWTFCCCRCTFAASALMHQPPRRRALGPSPGAACHLVGKHFNAACVLQAGTSMFSLGNPPGMG